MKGNATGEFEVTLLPLQDDRAIPLFGRMTIDKVFKGDLSGTSQGQMISTGTAVANSAGYVAIERVEGLLDGRRGTFVLQHNAIMDKGVGTLNIVVVPDSGTDELVGLTGKLIITRADGKHSYDLEYELPE